MNREIKFRAWNGVDMYKSPCSQISYIAINNFNWGAYSQNDKLFFGNTDNEHYVLMQYVGLNDKNNKEIYEGDLVLHDSGSVPSHKIVYSIDGFKMKRLKTNQLLPLRNHYNKIEVIGNIYENPELI